MKKAITRVSEITYHEEAGYLRVTSFADVEMVLEDAKNDFETAKNLVNNKPLPVLSDPRKIKSSTHEVRDFYASKERARNILAMAVLVDSLAIRLVVNFFIKFHKPHFPTRMFNDEKEAIQWLLMIAKKKEEILQTY